MFISYSIIHSNYCFYLSTNSFNNSYKITELDKAYKGKIKLNDLTVKSLGQDAEEFDEIDPKKITYVMFIFQVQEGLI